MSISVTTKRNKRRGGAVYPPRPIKRRTLADFVTELEDNGDLDNEDADDGEVSA
jgi:hypothetical protein